MVHIGAAYAENHGAYGWARIWRQPRAEGIRVSKQRVQPLMKEHGIRARGKRRFRVMTPTAGTICALALLRHCFRWLVAIHANRKQLHLSRLLNALVPAKLPGAVKLPPVEQLVRVHAMLAGKRRHR
jgi:transposase InsO family protein